MGFMRRHHFLYSTRFRATRCLKLKVKVWMCVSDLQEQMHRAMQLENERRHAEEEAIKLEAERQAALLAKEELARHAQDQMKGQEQLVGTQHSSTNTSQYRQKVIFLFINNHVCFPCLRPLSWQNTQHASLFWRNPKTARSRRR